MLYWNGNLSNIMAEAPKTLRLEGFAPARRLLAKIRGRRHCLEQSLSKPRQCSRANSPAGVSVLRRLNGTDILDQYRCDEPPCDHRLRSAHGTGYHCEAPRKMLTSSAHIRICHACRHSSRH